MTPEAWVAQIYSYVLAGSTHAALLYPLGQGSFEMPLRPMGDTWMGVAESLASGRVSSRSDPVVSAVGKLAASLAEFGAWWRDVKWAYVVLKDEKQALESGLTTETAYTMRQQGKRHVTYWNQTWEASDFRDPDIQVWNHVNTVWKVRIKRSALVPILYSVGAGVEFAKAFELPTVPPLRLIEKVEVP